MRSLPSGWIGGSFHCLRVLRRLRLLISLICDTAHEETVLYVALLDYKWNLSALGTLPPTRAGMSSSYHMFSDDVGPR